MSIHLLYFIKEEKKKKKQQQQQILVLTINQINMDYEKPKKEIFLI